MFQEPGGAYRTALSDGLVLRSVETRTDAERVAEFEASVHSEEPGIRELSHNLLVHHPSTEPRHWLFVEDADAGKIVSSLCLIPWTLAYAGTKLRSAEMGIVGTRSDYRRRGLVRALVDRFVDICREDGFTMSHIQGIPFFYRQFGYEYAIPLEESFIVELRQIQDKNETGVSGSENHASHSDQCAICSACDHDIDGLQGSYSRMVGLWDMHAVRDTAVWQYLLSPSMETACAADTYVVRDGSGRWAGYFRIARQGFGDGLILQECSPMDRPTLKKVFAFLKSEALRRKKPYVRLNLPRFSEVVQYAADLGGRRTGGYRWQIRYMDIMEFVHAIAPVLSTRLSRSDFSGFDGDFTVGWYKGGLSIGVSDGIVVSVREAPQNAQPDVSAPSNLLIPLFLGDRRLGECREFFPDVCASAQAERLFGVLFPRMNAYLHCPY